VGKYRGSLYETKHWVGRSHGRGSMRDAAFDDLMSRMRTLAPKLNAYISSKRHQRASAK
jgi:hypothetical protein